MHHASCLCGAIKINVNHALSDGNACHCTMCRKTSGHFWASVEAPKSAVTVQGEADLTWYQSSPKVRRGFCRTCGSSLFFEPLFHDWTAIAYGAFDADTQTKLARHIFTNDKGDYYDIADGLPQSGQ